MKGPLRGFTKLKILGMAARRICAVSSPRTLPQVKMNARTPANWRACRSSGLYRILSSKIPRLNTGLKLDDNCVHRFLHRISSLSGMGVFINKPWPR